MNLFGPLVELKICSQEEFDARDMETLLHPAPQAVTDCGESGGEPGTSFAERFTGTVTVRPGFV